MIAWLLYLVTMFLWIIMLRKARRRIDHKKTWFNGLLILGILSALIPGLFMLPLWALLGVYWFRYARRPPSDGLETSEENPIS